MLSRLFLILTLLQVSLAANSTSSAAELATLPNCAIVCLEQALSNSTCSPTDQQCICTNAPLKSAISNCVESTCTIKEALVTLNVTSIVCNAPIRDKRTLYNTISNVFGTISGVVVGLRLLSRYLSNSDFWIDDYAIVFTLIIGIPSSVINVHGLTSNGLGRDIWTLSFKNITDMLHVFFASEILYFTQVALVKISILFFFVRLFPGNTVRKLIYAAIGINFMMIILFGFLALFQCRPISYYWKKWDGEHTGTCLNNNALAWANAGISIAMDIWMLQLPMTQIYHLNLHWKKKIGVALMFGVGAFVTIVSILRLHSLVVFSKSQNPTWDYVAIGYWSTIEINVGIICACMPSLRILLVRIFPRLIGTTNNESKQNTGGVNSRGIAASNSRIQEGRVSSTRSYGIMYTKSYDVEYNRQPAADQGISTVELIEVDRESHDG